MMELIQFTWWYQNRKHFMTCVYHRCFLLHKLWYGHYSHQSLSIGKHVDSLRPRQNRRHFADDVFKCNFLNENVWIPIKISLKFVPKGPINNMPALVQIMAWRRPGDKPLSEPMMVSSLTHICVTRPLWVKLLVNSHGFLHYFLRYCDATRSSWRQKSSANVIGCQTDCSGSTPHIT